MKKLNATPHIYTHGFTLIELMITLLILSIVLGIGIPNFQETIQNGRSVSQINQVTGILAFARSEAAKRPNTTISLCGSNNTNSATPTCNSSNWEDGWLIMSDMDADRILDITDEDLNGNDILDPGEDINGNGVLDNATDQLLKIGLPLSGGNTLRLTGFANTSFIQFGASGIPDSSGTFTLCDDRGASEAKAVILSVVGQSRLGVDETSDDTVNNHAGVNVTCP